MVKVRDFAEKCGCTPQNIYKHLKNYADELAGHTRKTRQGTWLDDYACEFIQNVMYPKEVTADAEMAQEINRLRAALLQQAQENAKLTGQVAELQAQNDIKDAKLEAAEKALLVSKELEETKTSELEAANARAEAAEARAEAEADEKAALAAKNEALMNRGLWARITNKEV